VLSHRRTSLREFQAVGIQDRVRQETTIRVTTLPVKKT